MADTFFPKHSSREPDCCCHQGRFPGEGWASAEYSGKAVVQHHSKGERTFKKGHDKYKGIEVSKHEVCEL